MAARWEEAERFGWERPAPGVLRRRLPHWDATVGAVAGAHGLMVIDTGSSLREGAHIREELTYLTGLPVRHVALTHPHFDHVLGTAVFAGVRVYGAAGIRELLGSGREQEALRAEAVAHGLPQDAVREAIDTLVVPGREVTEELTVDLGRRHEVRLVHAGPGHSGHDLAALVPGDAQTVPVVFCGDLVEESGAPQAGPDAQPAHWPAAVDRLLTLGGPEAVYVPGHGALVGADFVAGQRAELARRFGAGGRTDGGAAEG